MISPTLEALHARVAATDLLDDPAVEDGVVVGRGWLEAAGREVTVIVDPDLDDGDDVDLDALLAGVSRILAIPGGRWEAVLEEIAVEIEEAVGDPSRVREQTDLRTDLEITSVVLLQDATLLSYAAPRQFPDSWIRAQLDDDLAVEEVVVDPVDDESGD
jgi:hypothetical protein